MRRINRRRITVLFMAAVMSVQSVLPVQAAAPEASVDETMYVNLDYYGNTDQINVVKGVSLAGGGTYTDYGIYEKVVNMTDKTEPVLGENSVTWELPAEGKRFFYQGALSKDSVELPWSFDVSYKKNGVPVKAETLSGASGLIEIQIQATPNEKAEEYYRNNMILSVVVPVDMEKCYSVDAPGAQVQSIGTMTAVVFAALPGEEGDFTVRLGTDEFESVGILMMMIPGTLDALEHVKDVKEAKDTWKEDGDRLYDSMDRILATMEGMKPSVGVVSSGLGNLNQAWSVVSAHRPEIEALSTRIVEELVPAIEQLNTLIPHLDTAKSAVEDFSDGISDLADSTGDLQKEVDHLTHRVSRVKKLLSDLADSLADLEDEEDEDEEISASLGQLAGAAGSVNTFVINLRKVCKEMTNVLEDAQDLANTVDDYTAPTMDALNDMQELLIRTSDTLTDTQSLLQILNTVMLSSGDSLDAGARQSFEGMKSMLDQSISMLDQISGVRSAAKSMKNTLDDEIKDLEEDSNFLNMDPEAEKRSLTSEQNKEPNSIQIILRTDEISADDEATDIRDQETDYTDGMTPLQRMWHVLTEMFRAIVEIFNNR